MKTKLNDRQLFQLCQQYGSAALEARRKFLGLLPEVQRRELWKAKGFGSVFEFAKKLAGVSEEQVNEVLHLEKKLIDKPILHTQLVTGQISHNKIARVVAIATSENENFWAAEVATLSKSALNTLVRDEKILQNTLSGQISLPESSITSTVDLNSATAARLKELQSKGIDIDDLINTMLDQREAQIAEDKSQLADAHTETAKSRYIPVKIQRILTKEHGNKCSIQTCKKQAALIHHTQRFALSSTHDPRFLAPLCKEHHEIAHAIDLQFLHLKKPPISSKNIAPTNQKP